MGSGTSLTVQVGISFVVYFPSICFVVVDVSSLLPLLIRHPFVLYFLSLVYVVRFLLFLLILSLYNFVSRATLSRLV